MASYLSLALKGTLLGFSIAAPVGPIGALCIQQTLQNGLLVGLACGLGAAFADAFYGSIAGLGLHIIQDFLIAQKNILGLTGGIFLCYLGVRTYFSPTHSLISTSTPSIGLGIAFITTFFLTLTNPMTILSFIAILANFILGSQNIAASLIFITGVFLGSCFWWLLLCSSINFFRGFIKPTILASLNKISGIIIVAFGVQSLATLAISYFK